MRESEGEPEQPTGQDPDSPRMPTGGPTGPPSNRPGDRSNAGPPDLPTASTSGPPQPVHETRGPSEIALGAVLLAVVVGLALVGQDHWRRGLLLAGIGLLVGAVVRLVLPARAAGLLAVRGRVFDSVVLAVLGTAVIVLTSSVPLPPG